MATRTIAAVLTPMANPTVEAEFRHLLPSGLDWVTGRLVSQETDPLVRLRMYAETIRDALIQFDSLSLAAVAFACTGSSYLIGREREAALATTLDMPVIWATGAILAELEARGVKRIAVISPYPAELHAAGLAYWCATGIDVIYATRVETGSLDTRSIYGLDDGAASHAVAAARSLKPDAILLSGTGMPTLNLLDTSGAPPVISSNYCLARALIRAFHTGVPK